MLPEEDRAFELTHDPAYCFTYTSSHSVIGVRDSATVTLIRYIICTSSHTQADAHLCIRKR